MLLFYLRAPRGVMSLAAKHTSQLPAGEFFYEKTNKQPITTVSHSRQKKCYHL